MKIKNYFTLILCVCGGILSGTAQCTVLAGDDVTISCGNLTQLSTGPGWNLTNDPGENAHSVFFTDANTGYVVGNNGSIRKTTDGGNSWLAQTSGTINGLFSVFFTNAARGIVVGGNGTILTTTNGGSDWNLQTITPSYPLRSVFFTDANTGIVVGDLGIIIKTTDGGNTWISKVNSTTAGINLSKIHFPTATTGYLTAAGDKIFKTIDGGETWTKLVNFSGVGCNAIYFTDINTGYAAGGGGNTGGGIIYKTTDGGNSWVTLNLQSGYGMESIFFTDKNTGYSGGGGYIFKTTDGGLTWKSQVAGLMATEAIHFPDANTGYAVGFTASFNKTLKYTLPNSVTWTPSKGLSAANIANPIATPNETTTYKVTTMTGTCVATDSVIVTVTPFVIDAGADLYRICGDTAQIPSVQSNYTGIEPLTYSWFPITGLNSTSIANPIATVKITTKYYVTVSTPNGCTATDSVIVIINPLTINTGFTKIITCGDSLLFDKPITNFTGALTYSWLPTAALNSTSIPQPIAGINQTTTYTLTVNTANGCIATDSVTVTVNPLIADAGTTQVHICGGSAQLPAVLSNYTGTATLKYSWLPIAGMNDPTLPNPTTTADGLTYTVTVKTTNGCAATDSVAVSLKPMDAIAICMVSVDTAKNVVIWDKPLSSVIDSVLIYKETNANGVYVKVGSVSTEAANVFRDVSSHPDVSSNKYQISLMDSCGVETAKSSVHKTSHLSINKGVGTKWNLIWEAYEGFLVTTYKIYRGTNSTNLTLLDEISGSVTQYTDNNAPAGDVYYQIEIVSPSICNVSGIKNVSRSNVAASTQVGIKKLKMEAISFSMYPNPTADNVTIDVKETIEAGTIIGIHSMLGAAVLEEVLTQNKQTISTHDLPSGFYTLTLKSKTGSSIQKLIIQK